MAEVRRIYKYELGLGTDRAHVELPQGAKLVLFDHQSHVFCAWFEVDPGAPRETRTFMVLGTGAEIPAGCEHRWSFQTASASGAPYVWHLYRVGGRAWLI